MTAAVPTKSPTIRIPLPPASAVAQLLSDLIGRAVTAKVVSATRMDPGAQAVAVYVGECQSLRAVAFCDLAVGASLGAALVMMPPVRVDGCVKAKRLDDVLTENLYEVFNVVAGVFPQNGAPRVVLRALHCSGGVPADVQAVLAKPGQRLDLEIAVAGYRSGRFAIVTP
jgi:hypothetical protein